MFFKKKVKKPVCAVKPHINKIKNTAITEESKKEIKKNNKKDNIKETILSEENNNSEK